MRRFACLFCAIALALPPSGAWAAEIVLVASSFPKEILSAYKRAFDAQSPEYRVEFVNFPATNTVSYVRDRAPGSRPDVFWGSSPDTFRALRRHDLLQSLADTGNPAIPAAAGGLAIDDPDRFYRGQALSGYGIMWNTRYLAANKLPAPKEWADLAKPEYFSHVAVSSPSRSGTTHLTVETILQGEGWNKGWAQLLAISGNSAAITERSFGVPDGVSNGQFGIGLVIDFFGLAAKNTGMPVEFVYPSVTAIVPANIALVAGAKSPEAGKRFIQFALSEEGQLLLLQKDISRLPVLPAVYAKAPAGYPNPFGGTIQAKVNFDSDLSEARYYVVVSLFDQMITFRHKELAQATKAIWDAETRLAGKPSAQLDEAKKLVFTPVVDDRQIADKALLALFKADKKDEAASKQKAKVEEEWASKAKDSYARAVELANGAK